MQNHSFDNLFGTFPGANGIAPGVPGFSQVDASGVTVTPQLLTDLAVGDLPHARNDFLRVWDSGLMGDAPTNQLYLTAADDNNNPSSIDPFFAPCNIDVKATAGYTFTHVGDQLAAKGLTWAWYQENLGVCGSYVAQENPFQFFTDSHSSAAVRDFSKFATDLSSGQLPTVSFVQPGPVHSMHPAAGVPITNGITWLDTFIQQVQANPVWNGTAIVVIWDSSGGWYDHVPPPQVDAQGYGQRVPMLVISPFAKKGFISHTQMDDVSILKFIQNTFGLQPLNARNQLGNDLSDMFSF
jgi:phospholipase C